MKSVLQRILSFTLYPLLLAVVLSIIYLSITYHWDYKAVYWKTTLFLLTTLMISEWIFPLSKDWSMTGRSFFRDVKYIFFDAPTIGLTKAGIGLFGIYYSENHQGLFTNKPVLISTIIFLLVFEFFQYWFHRFSHSGKGFMGQFLWKVHVAHHLPDRVYVLMHAVFNPINAFISTAIIQLTLVLLGIPPAAALAATLLIDLQSLISHFNADIRAGFFNYIFIGTETHRFHHSANIHEAKNFGNTLAIWDIVFGTFSYRPGVNPEKLGVANKNKYPKSENVLKVLAYPFVKTH